jgi:SAM-dependent methyltransferase
MVREIRCPLSGKLLTPADRVEAEAVVSGALLGRPGSSVRIGSKVLLRSDHAAAYPVAGDIPVLLAPEILTTAGNRPTLDLADPRWAEAYQEMAFYNAEGPAPDQALAERLLSEARRDRLPARSLLDAPHDAAAQFDAFAFLGPVEEKVVAQIGGSGVHAVRCLLSGAAEAWLVTPMMSEARFALDLARRTGFERRLGVAAAVGEMLPFPDETFDVIYAGGCLHHLSTVHAGPELARVLVEGGRFAAVEPWQTRLHHAGTSLVGKRERNQFCRPLDDARIAPLRAAFSALEVRHHGPFLRYLAIGASKAGRRPISVQAGLRIGRIDDAIPGVARHGGSVAVLAQR